MTVFMCMQAQEVVFFSNEIYKKPVTFFLKMVVKKVVFITKCKEKKLFETHYSLEKKLSASPKNGTPPPNKK